MLGYAVLCCAVLCCDVLRCAVMCCAMLCCAVMCMAWHGMAWFGLAWFCLAVLCWVGVCWSWMRWGGVGWRCVGVGRIGVGWCIEVTSKSLLESEYASTVTERAQTVAPRRSSERSAISPIQAPDPLTNTRPGTSTPTVPKEGAVRRGGVVTGIVRRWCGE